MSEPVNDGIERLTTLPHMAISAVDGANVDDGNDAMAKSPRKVDSCCSNVVTPAVKGATVSLRSKSEADALDDGHRWRKYGQKAGSRSHPKSYFKCSYVGCSVKKRVERDPDDPEFVITTYKGTHNHNVVTPSAKTSSSHGSTARVVDGDSVCIGSDNSGINLVSDLSRISSVKSGITTEEEEYGHDVTFGRCYRKMDTRSSDVTPAVKPEVVTFRTKSKIDVVDDGYRWRKYGLKSVLGSPHPRAYYKCTHAGCHARKTVCRDSDDPEFVTTTVQNTHNHVTAATSRGKTTTNHDIASSAAMGSIECEESSYITSLGFGNNMSSTAAETRCNKNFGLNTSDPLRFDIITSLDLGIGMDFFAIDDLSDSFYSFPESGMSFTSGNGKANAMPSPASYLMRSGEQNDTMALEFQQHQELEKVDEGTLEIEESRQLQFQFSMASPEKEPYHCNDLMNTGNIYLSKSPSSLYSFCAQYFVSIFLPYCKYQQLWDGGMQLLVSLKHLDLKHSALRWIPDLSKSQKLEDLELEGCINLVGISSIQHLTKLQHLNLKGCQSLRGLPSLMKLKFLKTLDLSHCSNLNRLPPSLGCISSLCELNLRNCEKLDRLPRSVVQLMTSLETLNISGCSSLWNSITGILISHSSEDASPEPPQPITLVQVDAVAATRASAVDSPPSEDPSLESRGEKTIILEDSNAFTREKTILAINNAVNYGLEEEQGKNAAIIPKKDRQQILNDEEHEDTESVGNEPLKIAEATTSVCCQVEDCGVELSSEKIYHQRVQTCQVHCNTNTAMVGKVVRRFCQLCSRFHLIEEYDEEERICRSRSARYRQKRGRQSTTTTGTDLEEKFLLLKRTRTITSDNTIALAETVKEFLSLSLEDLAEANAVGNFEHAVLAMIEQSSSLDDRATKESVLVSLAEWKQSVPEIVMSMQNAEAESAVASREMREMDVRLTRGELHLSLLDLELSLISEEEEQIEAEIQRLMTEKKR
ncbi:unnamed protein product [Linum trigynum]|uniref:Uncharacterized protein n=1 Tax=Linum trigynum TaxID=586398 RepID=A0AAV2EUL9_9ROSI